MAVTGIGGFFFRARDHKALATWYQTHLGVGGGDWGLWSQQAGDMVFAPVAIEDDEFERDKVWRLNFRVDDLDALLAKLHAAGVTVTVKPEWTGTEIGSFARLHDPEGNPIELWQPAAT